MTITDKQINSEIAKIKDKGWEVCNFGKTGQYIDYVSNDALCWRIMVENKMFVKPLASDDGTDYWEVTAKGEKSCWRTLNDGTMTSETGFVSNLNRGVLLCYLQIKGVEL